MNKAYFDKINLYSAIMLQVDKMLSEGLISSEEYSKIDTNIADKCGLSSCSIYRGIDLITTGFRGNMSHYEEVTQCQEP